MHLGGGRVLIMTSDFIFPFLTVALMGLGAGCLYLRHELQASLLDPAYGIPTRAGGERIWRRLSRHYARYEVVFLDLDELHCLNAELGYPEVDRRIRAMLVHRSHDILTARWYSGDEIVAIVPVGDGQGFAYRLLDSMRIHGLSATFGVVPAAPKLSEAVQKAMEVVAAAKAAGRRGTVCGDAPRSAVGRPAVSGRNRRRPAPRSAGTLSQS